MLDMTAVWIRVRIRVWVRVRVNWQLTIQQCLMWQQSGRVRCNTDNWDWQ